MSRQIFVFSVLLFSCILLAAQVSGIKLVYLRNDGICDDVYVGGYMDLTTDPCAPAGCEPFDGVESLFRKTINCPETAPNDFVVTAGWPYVFLNEATDCSDPLIELTARYDLCTPAEVNDLLWWVTLSCGTNGGVNVTRCKDSCGGSQCESWIASEECTAHLGSCPEITPVAVEPVAEPVTSAPITAPVATQPVPSVTTPSSNIQNGASGASYMPAVFVSAAALFALAI
jgi:hypothetical protein